MNIGFVFQRFKSPYINIRLQWLCEGGKAGVSLEAGDCPMCLFSSYFFLSEESTVLLTNSNTSQIQKKGDLKHKAILKKILEVNLNLNSLFKWENWFEIFIFCFVFCQKIFNYIGVFLKGQLYNHCLQWIYWPQQSIQLKIYFLLGVLFTVKLVEQWQLTSCDKEQGKMDSYISMRQRKTLYSLSVYTVTWNPSDSSFS